jgi:predicted pyridoxine 5'-phosphate oxidase superfamily flavin-nucleotide-binding protein
VKAFQEARGSRRGYARMESGADSHAALGAREAAFIAERDSFYLASVSETGWPYVQHRGGPAGFVRVLDEKTLGFADFAGNRQYVSVGNLSGDDRVSLFFMDYPNRTRLKLLGRAERIELGQQELLVQLTLPGYPAHVERGFRIHVEAYDWNCPQHITPRFTAAEVEAARAPLRERIAELEARLAAALEVPTRR